MNEEKDMLAIDPREVVGIEVNISSVLDEHVEFFQEELYDEISIPIERYWPLSTNLEEAQIIGQPIGSRRFDDVRTDFYSKMDIFGSGLNAATAFHCG